MTRLVASFPGGVHLSGAMTERIHDLLDECEAEWRTLVIDGGGIVYDLDAPLTIVVQGDRVTVEQTPTAQ